VYNKDKIHVHQPECCPSIKTISVFSLSLYFSVSADKSKFICLEQPFVPSLSYPHLSIFNICFTGNNKYLSNKHPLSIVGITAPLLDL